MSIPMRDRETSRPRRQPWQQIVAAASVVVALGGCSSQPAESNDPLFDMLILEAIEQAAAAGASDGQLELLRQSEDAGHVPVETLRLAVHATIECFVEAGFEAEYLEPVGPEGLALPSYRVWTDGELSPGDDALIEECDSREGFWVNKVYQLQPSSDELRVEFVNGKADELRACLEDAGYPAEAGADGVALAQQAGRVATESQGAVDCLQEVGVL